MTDSLHSANTKHETRKCELCDGYDVRIRISTQVRYVRRTGDVLSACAMAAAMALLLHAASDDLSLCLFTIDCYMYM